MAQDQADWVNFAAIKAKVSFEQVLEHSGLTEGLKREGEEITGPCPVCQGEGFKVNLEKNSFSCQGCKKRGSVIDFVSAYKKVGLKEAGKLLKEMLETSAKPQVKEAAGAGKSSKKRKGKMGKVDPAPAGVPASLRAELLDILSTIDVRIKEIADMTELVKLKLEGRS